MKTIQLTPTSTSKKEFFQNESVRKKFEELIGNNTNSFIANILDIVSNSDLLAKASNESLYMAAMMAATLNLSLNKSLGYAYIVPYKGEAQFQIGYKGLIQLAQRSGQYLSINCVPVYVDDKDEDVSYRISSYLPIKKSTKIIGYCAYFKLINGYEHKLSMSNEELSTHGKKYSKAFNQIWTSNFESMAKKTVIKLLLQRFGPMSAQMQQATIADQSVIKNIDTMEVEYVDNEKDTEADKANASYNKRLIDAINKCETPEELMKLREYVKEEETKDAYELKVTELSTIKTKDNV